MAFDVAQIRAQFPILSRPVHGRALHYLDNSATSQMPEAVLAALAEHETGHRANVLRGVHFLAEAATEAYEQARIRAARYVNAAEAAEIVFTSGTTMAINLVAHSLGQMLEPGDEVVITRLEHHSNIVPWQLLRDRAGIKLKVLPVSREGRLDLDAIDELLTPRCKLLAVSHVSNVTGAVSDLGRLVAAARAVGAMVLVDGAQRTPHGAFDVQALGVDFYAFSGHKMFGPNAIGVLWGRRGLLEEMPPFLGGGEMIRSVSIAESTWARVPHKFEAGTPPIAQAVGLAAAMDWVESLPGAAVEEHLNDLAAAVLDGLTLLDGGRGRLRLIGPASLQNRAPVISFHVEGAHPHDICQILDGHGVALRGGHHCAQPLMEAFDLTGTTRASLAVYNDRSDVDALLSGLEDAIGKLT